MDLIVVSWVLSQPDPDTSSYSDALVELSKHKHPAEDFIDAGSGLNIYDEAVSGMKTATLYPVGDGE